MAACAAAALGLAAGPGTPAADAGPPARAAVADAAPDLTVSALRSPARVVRGRTATVVADVSEVGGAAGATATVSLAVEGTPVASAPVTLAPGETVSVSLPLVLEAPGTPVLSVTVADAVPAEVDTSDNTAAAPIVVSRYDADGAVASSHALATEIGARILARGGNAIDAAAAMAFALSVVEPHASGLGGAATALLHLADGSDVAIDARETAPASAGPDMFVGIPGPHHTTSGVSVGVPGMPAAIDEMLRHHGTMTLAQVVRPAERLARRGFVVGPSLANATTDARFARFQPETVARFRHADGTPLVWGDRLRQPSLARALRVLAREGVDAFYRGLIARAIVRAQRRASVEGAGGGMTLADLAGYTVRVREPAAIAYRDATVLSAPPSSGGGITLLEALRLLERFPIGRDDRGYGFGAAATLHVEIEALRLALADARAWVGDDAFVPVPAEALLSDAYIAARSALIDEGSRMPVAEPGDPTGAGAAAAGPAPASRGHTTHFSVLDRLGNMVSFTGTLSDGFGSGITVPGWGFVLNDSLALFNAAPGASPANDAAAGKRPRGSTAPTIVLRGSEPVAATGTRGAGWIPSILLHVVSNLVDHGMTAHQAVAAPRFWLEGAQAGIVWNAQLPETSVEALRALGHPLTPRGAVVGLGSAETIAVDADTFAVSAAADPRTPEGQAALVAPSVGPPPP